jgi:hypothetical protein
MSTSSPAIRVRIGPRVGAAQLAVVATVFIVGLLTGVVVGKASIRPASTTAPIVRSVVQESGPQSHIGDMITLRSQILGHPFPPSNHREP